MAARTLTLGKQPRTIPLRNIPSDHEVLAAVNERARQIVNSEIPENEPKLPEGFRCDMSRVGFIRRRWERAVEEYRNEHGLCPIEALGRIETELRRGHAVLHIDRR